jgi:hypothetical protein
MLPREPRPFLLQIAKFLLIINITHNAFLLYDGNDGAMATKTPPQRVIAASG